MKVFVLFIVLFTIAFSGCKQNREEREEFSSVDISHVITKMTEIMVHDVTHPALAAIIKYIDPSGNHYYKLHHFLNIQAVIPVFRLLLLLY